MFGFVRRIFVSAIMVFSYNISSANELEYFSINNQECKVRLEIVNINSNEPIFFPFSIKTSNTVVVVIMAMIPMQNCVFLMLLKI